MRRLVVAILLTASGLGCDLDHRKKCEWFLVPDADRKVDEGFIPVCARNFEVNKQDCRLQAKLEYAKSNYKRKFRYVDLKIESVALPRTIKDIKFCD